MHTPHTKRCTRTPTQRWLAGACQKVRGWHWLLRITEKGKKGCTLYVYWNILQWNIAIKRKKLLFWYICIVHSFPKIWARRDTIAQSFQAQVQSNVQAVSRPLYGRVTALSGTSDWPFPFWPFGLEILEDHFVQRLPNSFLFLITTFFWMDNHYYFQFYVLRTI